MKKWIRKTVVPKMGFAFINVLGSTLRVEVEDPGGLLQQPQRRSVIFAFWHNRILMMPYFYKRFQPGRQLAALISASRDGEIIANIISCFGLKSVRGSTSRRGSTALRAATRLLQEENMDIAVTPDGPRGPRYQMQQGVIQLAQSTGKPIIPLSYDFKWKKELPSWDRFQVPCPLTPCRLFIGAPISVPADLSASQIEALNRDLAVLMGE